MNPVPAKRDAYGREIWAFLNGSGDPYEIVERDDGYITAALSTSRYFSEFRKWPERQRQGIRFLPGDRTIDVGCGAGRVALYLQNHGYQVTAIDNSPLAIKTARRRGVRDARLLPFQNIGRLRPNQFDGVVMFGNNFGLFGSYTKSKRLLRELHRITTKRAVLIAESVDPYMTSEAAHRKYHNVNRQRGRMAGQIRIRVRFRECVGPWFDYLLVAPAEMEQIFDGTGWKAERFIRDDGPAYVAVVEKI